MIIDPSGRGPTMRQLLVAGAAGLLVFVLIMTLLLARYQGYVLHPEVDVTADLGSTGDGLPDHADVKFRGVLVGSVKNVSVTEDGALQRIHLEMKPGYLDSIPANVTARVVPSNLFAVTSVELVYNGPDSASLHENSDIGEDRSQGTIALQDTLTTVHSILDRIDPVQLGRVLGTLSYALDGDGRMPGSTLERLDTWMTQVRAAVPDASGTLADFATSFQALNQSAPELTQTLADSVRTARTIADKRGQLVALLSGGSATVDKVDALFATNPDVGKKLTVGLADMFGALASDPDAIPLAIANLNEGLRALNTTFHWGPQRQMVWNLGLTLTPYRPYDRSNCPRYGDLAGPSCTTAPVVSDPGQLPDALKPRALDAARGLPPVVPMPGLPAIAGTTTPVAPNSTGAQGDPEDPLSGTPLGSLFQQLLPGVAIPSLPAGPAPTPQPQSNTPATHPAAATITQPYTGDAAVGALLGRRPTMAEYLLLSSILRGGTLQVTEESDAGR